MTIYIEMLPKLKAREALLNVNIAAIGAGMMEKEDRQKLINEWKNAADIKKVKKKLTKEQYEMMLSTMGIKVVKNG